MKPRIATSFPFAAFCAILLSPALAQSTLFWGGGSAGISDGTAIPTTTAGLTGTWSESTSNWSSNRSTTVYQPWAGASIANLGYFTDAANSVITVGGNKTVSGMFAAMSGTTGANRVFQLNGAAAGTTLTLAGETATILVASIDATRGIVIGANNTGETQLSLGDSETTLIKDGAGSFIIGNSSSFLSSDAFIGDVLIRSGIINLSQQASLAGVTKFDLTGYRPSVTVNNANGNNAYTNPTLTLNLATAAGTFNRIHDEAAINLNHRATLNLLSGNANGVENIGSLTVNGTGFILNSAGTAGQVINLGSLSRGADGRGAIVVSVFADDNLPRHQIRINPGLDEENEPNPTGFPTDVLLPWLATNRGEWMMIDSTDGNNQLTRIESIGTPLEANLWIDEGYDETSNLRIPIEPSLEGGMSGALTGNLTINSLAFLGAGATGTNQAAGRTLNLGGNTLTLNAGALGLAPSQNVAYTINNGTIQTPGSTPLHINTGNSNTSFLVLDSVLTGAMDIHIFGITNTMFGPQAAAASTANSYTGTVYVNGGTLNANKDSAITGDVVVAPGGGLVIGRVAALASTSNITLGRDAFLGTGGLAANIGGAVTNNGGLIRMENAAAGLTFSGGFAFNGGIFVHNSSAASRLNLASNISYAASSAKQAVFQRANPAGAFSIHLNNGASSGNAERTFNVANSNTLAASLPEMVVDTIIANGGTGSATGSIRKTGNGTLMLVGNNTYTGGTIIDGGTLRLGVISAAAQSGLSGTATNTGGIENDTLTFNAPITGTMAVGQTVTGTSIATPRNIQRILNDYQVVLNGTVGTAASVAAIDIALNAVSRSGSLTGNVTVSGGATLQLDDDSVMNFAPLANGVTNTISGSGSIVLNGDFAINLAGADTTPGNSWTLVNVATLSETFGGTFNVQGFTKSGSEWTSGDWVFSETTGVLSIGSAPPPDDNYASWATDNGIDGEPFDGDFDNDGISNGMEYALGLNPTVNSQPAGSLSGNTLSFTKGAEAIENEDVSWIIETSTDLGIIDDWTPAVTQPAGDPAATISYVFTPGSPAKNFARLKVVQVVAP